MASVGILLKKEREKKKISLDQISEETKIGKKYLQAIEADNYTIFPGETYIIGFIRNYARSLGLNPSEVINLYKSMKIGSSIVEETRPEVISEERPIGKRPLKKEAKKIIKKELQKSRATKGKETPPLEEDFEVVELIEELPEKGVKKERTEEIKKQESKLFKSPLKEKKLINIAHVIIGTGALIVILVLFFMIRFIYNSFSNEHKTKIYTDLSEVKLLEFSADVLHTDFVANEYYKIALGDKTYNILFERLTLISDTNMISKSEKEKLLEFAFHINDVTVPLKLNEEKLIDFDYDTQMDLEVKISAHNNDLINAKISKLHSFIVVSTNEKIDLVMGSNANVSLKAKKRSKTEGEGTKGKIIFEAEVVGRKTYFRAWIDGVEQEGTIYYPGDKIHLEANDALQLNIGNAGALKAKINGEPKKLGKSGEVVNPIIKWERDPYDDGYNLVIKDLQ